MREELEKEALQSVCPCWYYDLADNIDSLSDYDLYQIAQRPYICHIESAIIERLSIPEVVAELRECPDYHGIVKLTTLNEKGVLTTVR
jgi:hypothetical protein